MGQCELDQMADSVQEIWVCQRSLRDSKTRSNRVYLKKVRGENKTYVSKLYLVNHRPFNKLDVKVTSIFQLDYYIKLLVSLTATMPVALSCVVL